jgi:hypothetical protein
MRDRIVSVADETTARPVHERAQLIVIPAWIGVIAEQYTRFLSKFQ